MGGQKIYNREYCAACYFRTIAEFPNRKCLIQLTEKCNLFCEHCFVSAEHTGNEMDFESIKNIILPQLIKNKISKVTLTGGEPFVYDKLIDVVQLLIDNNISVTICTNATLITEKFLNQIERYQNIHFNVSLDGFSSSSHGRFRGNDNEKLYDKIIENIKILGEKGLLNGILVTPNVYATIQEYRALCEFAKSNNAKYVLMNPLSQFGRGEQTIDIAYNEDQMRELKYETENLEDDNFEMVYIRFPNEEKKPLSECVAGKIMYIFTNGNIAYCPYLVFASRDQQSIYDENEFLMGNIYDEKFNWENSIRQYQFPVELSEVCGDCKNVNCKKGCYAAKIAYGKKLNDKDINLCPQKF